MASQLRGTRGCIQFLRVPRTIHILNQRRGQLPGGTIARPCLVPPIQPVTHLCNLVYNSPIYLDSWLGPLPACVQCPFRRQGWHRPRRVSTTALRQPRAPLPGTHRPGGAGSSSSLMEEPGQFWFSLGGDDCRGESGCRIGKAGPTSDYFTWTVALARCPRASRAVRVTTPEASGCQTVPSRRRPLTSQRTASGPAGGLEPHGAESGPSVRASG